MVLPLKGIKVLEFGHVLAAPFCGVLLADFGAEVIKIEKPIKGDGLRHMGPVKEGKPLWYTVENRNKKSITLNLKKPKGIKIAKTLISKSDVIIENFKPGTLEKMGLDWETIQKLNNKAILARISGYGQTGPYRNRYGYDRIGLGMGGLTYISGFKDKPPTKPGVSVADYLSGLFTCIGIMIALYHRDVKGGNVGQVIDVGLYESVFRIMEFVALDYDLNGTIKERSGNAHPATVPGGHYKTKDGKWICISVGNDDIFKRFAKCIGREDLLESEKYKIHANRLKNRDEIEKITADWVAQHTREECIKKLENYVPVGPIYSIDDIFKDPHYKARQMIAEVKDKLFGNVKMQGIVPKLSLTPGEIRWTGPDLGEHNTEILTKVCGYSKDQIMELEKEGVI